MSRLSKSADDPGPEPGANPRAQAQPASEPSPVWANLADAQSLVANAKDLYEHDPANYLERVGVALERVRALGRIDLEVQLSYYQGCAADVLGRFEDGYAAMKHADQLASTLSDPFWQGKTAGGLGGILVGRGDCTGAIEQLERSLPLRRAASDRLGEATSLNNLGFAYLVMHGLQNSAVELFDKA